MRFRSLFTAAAAALVIAVGGTSTASADINLPTGNCGTSATNNCLIFDDFTVYSLAVLNAQAGYGDISNNDPYDVGTNGVDLHNVLVVGTGLSGAGTHNTDIITNGSVDNAYSTPSAQGGGITNFVPSSTNQGTQGSAIAGTNSTTTWDINTSDLKTYLAGGQLAFFFNLNQANSGSSYLGDSQDALAWMSVTLTDTNYQAAHSLTDAQCALDTSCARTFWLDGNACDANNGNCDPTQTWGGTAADPYRNTLNPNNTIPPNANSNLLTDQTTGATGHDEWAFVHGQICMSPQGAIVGFGPCASGDHVDSTINQNLSENNAAFALYSQMLQYYLVNGSYTRMSVDFRMAALTNGYEQLVIFSALNIPEPVTLMMFAAGLLGLAMIRRRKMKLA